MDTEIDRALGREIRIVGQHLHLQAVRAIDYDRADIAAADHPKRLAGDLDAHEFVLFPLAGLGRRVRGGDLARERQHQADGVLGRGDGIAVGRVHHDDALGGRGREIDIVDPDAGAADDLEVLGAIEQLGGNLGGRADGKPVELADHFRELILVESGLDRRLDAAVGEYLHRGG